MVLVTVQHSRGWALTPDDLAECVNDDCRVWFDDAVEIARRFNKLYPKLVAETEAEAEERAA